MSSINRDIILLVNKWQELITVVSKDRYFQLWQQIVMHKVRFSNLIKQNKNIYNKIENDFINNNKKNDFFFKIVNKNITKQFNLINFVIMIVFRIFLFFFIFIIITLVYIFFKYLYPDCCFYTKYSNDYKYEIFNVV